MDSCSSGSLCSSRNDLNHHQSCIHLNASKILRLWFNYFIWQLYMQLHTRIRNLDEYYIRERTRGKEQSYFKGVFVEATITGRNNQDSDSDSAAESDKDDNADDRRWLRKDSLGLTAFHGLNLVLKSLVRRNNSSGHILQCVDFGVLAWNCLFTPIIGKFFGHIFPTWRHPWGPWPIVPTSKRTFLVAVQGRYFWMSGRWVMTFGQKHVIWAI